ncbi:MAG: deoxyhypusine synthase family protein [Deltaproteobacteria bacterium]|nr:deoxyhypusine synthase family protein [Deltaproteobacteria bacterium]MBW2401771.1 deoxyhypusine synthase family protein [Deltaproteobacteria bacterium]
MSTTRDKDRYHTGHDDGLEPLAPLDPAAIGSVDELVRAMGKTAFGGRRLGEATDVLESMVRDPDCFRVVTISGAMTIAKQGMLLCEMIDRGWVQAVVTTGALMTHGLSEGAGMLHFKHRPGMSDEDLYQRGYNRVYDTIELEKNLDDVEYLLNQTLDQLPEDTVLSSRLVCEALGRELAQHGDRRAILKSALERNVPVYIPAFTDSELGLDLAIYNQLRIKDGRPPRPFDPFRDLDDFTDRIRAHETLGIFTIGGGVPRNWAQQVAPYLEIMRSRTGSDDPIRRYRYAVRICPEPEHWGGLSGCSYSEGVSWGKFVPESEGGRFAELYADATIAWPLVVRAVIERLEKEPV